MAGGGGGQQARELDQTPTWAVSLVCGVIVIISILLEKVLHKVREVFLFFTSFPLFSTCFSHLSRRNFFRVSSIKEKENGIRAMRSKKFH